MLKTKLFPCQDCDEMRAIPGDSDMGHSDTGLRGAIVCNN